MSYLVGGTGPGESGHHHGARDRALPIADQPVRIDRRLVFVGRSKRWDGGGVCAVLGPDDQPAETRLSERGPAGSDFTLARAWLITFGQLLDVWSQENGGAIAESVTWSTVTGAPRLDLHSGRYRRLDRLDRIDGHEAFTITCGPEMAAEVNPPTDAYLDMVRNGLMESWILTRSQADHYLQQARPPVPDR